jgi:hypothetical protein
MDIQSASSSAHARHCAETADPDWQRALPTEWRTAVVTPLRFSTYREYDMPATRSLGYDEHGKPCYYRHTFLLDTLRSDDDEEFYEAYVYGEEVHAWRLFDERWLIWQIVRQECDCRGDRGVYRFSERRPS